MSFIFAGTPPSYAEEQLSFHLATLSTVPVSLSTSTTALKSSTPPPHNLQSAAHDLSSSKSIPRDKLVELLKSLAKIEGGIASYGADESNKALEDEVMSRAVTMVWKEVMEAFVQGALELEEERSWWEAVVNSRRGVMTHLVQTLPHRLYKAIRLPSCFSVDSLRSLHFPSRSALFNPLPNASAALTSMASPYNLTRREILSSRKALTEARDSAARRIGVLASQGPRWGVDMGDLSPTTQAASIDLGSEATRLYDVVCQVLDVPLSAPATSSRRSRSSTITPPNVFSPILATPSTLLEVLTVHLPRSQSSIDQVLKIYGRPSALTRLWFPLLFLPPALLTITRMVVRNKEWMKEQIRNTRETVKGFFVQWVWEPVEDIANTLRRGGEGLGVAPTTVQSDKNSLERMVVDLGRDYYHMSELELDGLAQKVRRGDMEEVLRLYEKEMKSPVKNALMGHLIRALLIQVQKTKTDLSLSLLSLDHLLRSQQLTFAFVGVAPSVLILYGVGGWFRRVWKGEERGKGRKRRYFSGLRDIERLLLTSPKHNQDMSDRDRGLLIVSVSGLRTWAAGLGSKRDAFLDDLRMVEDPLLPRGDKLRVVERIWRCWGLDGKNKL